MTPPVDYRWLEWRRWAGCKKGLTGADLRAALEASCLRGALPPVDLRAVCLVRAMVVVVVVVDERSCVWMRLMSGAVQWMRDGDGRAGAAYMVIGGAGSCLENHSLLRVQNRPGTPKAKLLAMRAATKLTSERACAIGSLGRAPEREGARSLIWKARPCVTLIRRGRCVIWRPPCTRPLALINTTTPAPSLIQHPISPRLSLTRPPIHSTYALPNNNLPHTSINMTGREYSLLLRSVFRTRPAARL